MNSVTLIDRTWINWCTLVVLLAPKVAMYIRWQNITYILLVVLLKCGRGNRKSPPSSNTTYLPDVPRVLFAAGTFLFFLNQQASTFVCIPSNSISAGLEASEKGQLYIFWTWSHLQYSLCNYLWVRTNIMSKSKSNLSAIMLV